MMTSTMSAALMTVTLCKKFIDELFLADSVLRFHISSVHFFNYAFIGV